jgi:hypothetical protein
MINENEIKMAAKFLQTMSEEFANHGCNDVDESFYDGWSLYERRKFVHEFHEWNGDPEEYTPDFLQLPDFALMAFLAYKLSLINFSI